MSVWGPPRSSQHVEGRGTPARSSIAKKDGAGTERKRHLGLQPDHSGSEPSTPTRAARRPGPAHERAAAPSSVPSTAKSRLSQQPSSPAPARAQHARGVTNPAFSPDKLRQQAAHGAGAHRAAPAGDRGPEVRASLSLKGHAGKSRPDGTPRAVRAKPVAPAAARGGAAAVRSSVTAPQQAPQPWPIPPALAAVADAAAVAGPSPAVAPLPVAIDNPLAGSSPTTSNPLARSASAPPTTPTGATFRMAPGGEELETPTLAHWRAPAAEAEQRGAGAAGPSSSYRMHTPGSGDRSIGPLAPHVLEALRVSHASELRQESMPH